ncbi:efflux RND transporter permease subunit [bacterium]|nr:efflux RND transporter permease subunit [bacterium]
MRSFLRLVIDNPVLVLLLAVVAVWSGCFAFLHLPVGLFPGLDVPVVNVISHDPGASSGSTEMLVTRPIEERLRTVPGVRRVSSNSIQGISQISVEFEWGTHLVDARQLVQAEISSVQSTLPDGVAPRLENIGTTLEEIAGCVIYGDDPVALRIAARTDLSSRLAAVPGVSRVEVIGGADPAFVVSLRLPDLARKHLMVSDVASALAEFNTSSALDFLDRGTTEYFIRGESRLQTVEDVETVPILSDGPHPVLLRDIATVRASTVPRHYSVHGNAVPAVAFIVSKSPSASTIAVVRGVDKELEQLHSVLPPGATIQKFYDQADIVSEARDSLFHDLLIGAWLAALILLLFMGTLRATVIVVLTIPIALLTTLAFMRAFGQTLNVITLSALTLAVGMVVDDAIVVAESVVRHLQAGTDSRTASLEGAAEIAGPDASGTLTTVAAFAPLLFLGGLAGLFVRPFGLAVSIALLASLATSLTIVPAMFARFGKLGTRRTPGGWLLKKIDGLLQAILRIAMRVPWLTVIVALALLGLGGLAARLGPMNVLPPIDEGAILIEYIMPPGVSLEESDRIGGILERGALAEPGVVTVYRRTGSPERGFQIEGVNRGELTIKLAPRTVRSRTLSDVMESLRRKYGKIPGVTFLFHQPTQEKMDESLSGLPAVFGVTIFGTDLDQLTQLSTRVEQIMSEDGQLANIINNAKFKTPQITILPKQASIARYGLKPGDIFNTVRAARHGVSATTITDQRKQTEVILQFEKPEGETLDWLENLSIPTPSGDLVPLQDVAEIRVDRLPAAIAHLNGQREITILAEINGSIPSAVDRLRSKFADLSLPPGYSIAFTGQYQVLLQTIRDFALIGLAAVTLIFLIMALQFRSWIQPFIILVTIPFALVGAIILLAATSAALDISAGMGALTLVGIAVNNAIVLLDYSNQLVANGTPVRESLRTAASVRLRPILITALTTIFALLPVAVNPSIGSRIFQPFAITVVGGLLSATLATLILVPVLQGIGSPKDA